MRIVPQLWHTGAARAWDWQPEAEVESPSDLVCLDDPRGHAMSEEDITDTIAAFASAAGTAKAFGFDAVQLQGRTPVVVGFCAVVYTRAIPSIMGCRMYPLY